MLHIDCYQLYCSKATTAFQVIQETATSGGDPEGPFYQAVFSRAHDIFHMRRRMMNLQVRMNSLLGSRCNQYISLQTEDTKPLRARMFGHIM